jgi:hypothetical protein
MVGVLIIAVIIGIIVIMVVVVILTIVMMVVVAVINIITCTVLNIVLPAVPVLRAVLPILVEVPVLPVPRFISADGLVAMVVMFVKFIALAIIPELIKFGNGSQSKSMTNVDLMAMVTIITFVR